MIWHPSYRDYMQSFVQWNGIPVTGILSYRAVCSMKWYPSYRDSLIYSRLFNEMVSQLPGFSYTVVCHVKWYPSYRGSLIYSRVFNEMVSQLPGLYTAVRSMKWHPSYRNNLIYSRVFNEMVSQLPGFSDIQPCVQWNDIPVTGIPSYTAVCSMKWYPSYRDFLIYSPIFDEMATQNTGIIALCF